MTRYWIRTGLNGEVIGVRTIQGKNVPNQPEVGLKEVTKEEYEAAKRALPKPGPPPRPTPNEEIDRFWDRPSLERSVMEWVRQKLNIDEATAKREILSIHQQRRGSNG